MINRLGHDYTIISEWSYEKCMVLNTDKFHFLNISFNESLSDISFNDTAIANVTKEKILGIVVDNKLKLKCHLKVICGKANQVLCTYKKIKTDTA